MEIAMTDARPGALDRLMAEYREALDGEVARSGAVRRVRDYVMMRRPVAPLEGLHWQRIAAAVLIASMLGGAVDLLLPERVTDPVDVAIVEALYDLDQPGTR
jgi:hypothetical protein